MDLTPLVHTCYTTTVRRACRLAVPLAAADMIENPIQLPKVLDMDFCKSSEITQGWWIRGRVH